MRLLYTISILSLLLFSCKNETKPAQKKETKSLTTAEKIANNYGFKHFIDITEIDFTFNVDRDSSHFERSWSRFWTSIGVKNRHQKNNP